MEYKNLRSNYLSKNSSNMADGANFGMNSNIQPSSHTFKQSKRPGGAYAPPKMPVSSKVKSLDMRNPGGNGIIGLQNDDRKGRFKALQALANDSKQPGADPRSKEHLGLSADTDIRLLSLGQLSYPKFPYDDRFTDIEINKFRELFTYFDREGNGTMDVRDLP